MWPTTKSGERSRSVGCAITFHRADVIAGPRARALARAGVEKEGQGRRGEGERGNCSGPRLPPRAWGPRVKRERGSRDWEIPSRELEARSPIGTRRSTKGPSLSLAARLALRGDASRNGIATLRVRAVYGLLPDQTRAISWSINHRVSFSDHHRVIGAGERIMGLDYGRRAGGGNMSERSSFLVRMRARDSLKGNLAGEDLR